MGAIFRYRLVYLQTVLTNNYQSVICADMEDLRSYLNSLDKDQQLAYANRCGTSVGYLRKALSIGQRFKFDLAQALSRESSDKVTMRGLGYDIPGSVPTSKPTAKRTPKPILTG
jgi:hypothetical protein